MLLLVGFVLAIYELGIYNRDCGKALGGFGPNILLGLSAHW